MYTYIYLQNLSKSWNICQKFKKIHHDQNDRKAPINLIHHAESKANYQLSTCITQYLSIFTVYESILAQNAMQHLQQNSIPGAAWNGIPSDDKSLQTWHPALQGSKGPRDLVNIKGMMSAGNQNKLEQDKFSWLLGYHMLSPVKKHDHNRYSTPMSGWLRNLLSPLVHGALRLDNKKAAAMIARMTTSGRSSPSDPGDASADLLRNAGRTSSKSRRSSRSCFTRVSSRSLKLVPSQSDTNRPLSGCNQNDFLELSTKTTRDRSCRNLHKSLARGRPKGTHASR